MQIEADI